MVGLNTNKIITADFFSVFFHDRLSSEVFNIETVAPELHLRGNVFTEPLLSNGRLLSCDWPAPEMWAVPTGEF
jgi:hypothetical protein